MTIADRIQKKKKNNSLNLLSMDKDEKIDELLGLENKIELILNENTKLTNELGRRAAVIEDYQKEVERLSKHLLEFTEENHRMSLQSQKQESKGFETHDKLAVMIDINEKLNDIISEKPERIEKYQREMAQHSVMVTKSGIEQSKIEKEMDALRGVVEASEKNVALWQSKYREAIENLDSLRGVSKQYEQYQAREEDLERRVKAVYDENVNLNNMISEKDKELADYHELDGKVDVLIEENERLNQVA